MPDLTTTKLKLIDDIITNLQQALETQQTAANNAHLAAIDEQSIAETQYDTLAIEAGYLAEGQSRRVLEIKLALQQFAQLKTNLSSLSFDENSPIAIGAIVEIATSAIGTAENDEQQARWYFLAPAAAGFTSQITTPNGKSTITVITAHSPLGQSLIDLYQFDQLKLQQGAQQFDAEILTVI